MYPESKIVFISPCISKRYEASNNENIDNVLTFEELGTIFVAHKIDVLKTEATDSLSEDIGPLARGFAASGGVANAIKNIKGDLVNELVINGLDKTTIRELKMLCNGKKTENFVEVMSCENGCIGGPCTISRPKVALNLLKKYQ